MKIQIKSPLVTVTYEDSIVLHNGYIKHGTPEDDELIKLIRELKDSAIEVVDRMIVAALKGGIDLKKLEEFKEFEEIIEKNSK